MVLAMAPTKARWFALTRETSRPEEILVIAPAITHGIKYNDVVVVE